MSRVILLLVLLMGNSLAVVYASAINKHWIEVRTGAQLQVHFPHILSELYQINRERMIWLEPLVLERFEQQLSLLHHAKISPLFSQQIAHLQTLRSKPIEFDVWATDTLLLYLAYQENLPKHGSKWLFAQEKALRDPFVSLSQPSAKAISQLRESLKRNDLTTVIDGLRSPLQQNDTFMSTFSNLKAMSKQDFPVYKQNGLAREGDALNDKQTLLMRLSLVGIDVSSMTDWDTFDPALTEAIKRFQQMHGLKPDGIIGPNTKRWINAEPQTRLSALALNSERSKLWPEKRDWIILVNVPNYDVSYWVAGERVFQSNVVVGREERKTPIMIGELESVILNPTWNVPRKIMVEDIIPKVKQNPHYLVKQKIQIIPDWRSDEVIDWTEIDWANLMPEQFQYKMRQLSGKRNALGLVKFNTPNPRAIFLHDTPSKELFRREKRAYSSGCIRVEYAEKFAETLISIQGLDELWLQKKAHDASNQYIPLKRRVPVHIIYQTVWFEDDELQYRDDIYKYDRYLSNQG